MKQKIKAGLSKNKKLFKYIMISLGSLVLVFGAAVLFCYFYYQANYPDEIVLDGAYKDTSLLNLSFTERDLKATYDTEGAVYITAQNNTAVCNSDKVEIKGQSIEIKSEGVYIFSGEINGGMIKVSGTYTDKIQLVLNGFSLTSKDTPAIYIKSANKVFITTAKDTLNTLSDTKGYTYTDEGKSIDGTIFSRADLTLSGEGTLTVNGKNAHGIVSKDDLVIGSGDYEIVSVKKGLFGKDSVKINDCNLKINAGTDGICSDNTDSDKGFVYVKDGQIKITATKDGIQSQNVMVLENPTVQITTDKGYENAPIKETNKGKGKGERNEKEEEATSESLESAKALKSATDIIISGGNYVINSRDDSIHADNSIKITGGSFNIKSGDDGIHAEHTLLITKGSITVQNCFEGLEAYQIAIQGGDIFVTATDDGINASSGDSTSFLKELFAASSLGKLEITGGTLSVYSKGDSLDSNGIMSLTGGTVFLMGPDSQGDSMVDCDSTRLVDGATLIVIGNGDSAEEIASDSEFFEIENPSTITKDTSQEAGTVIEIKAPNGKSTTFTAPQSFSYIIATTPQEGYTLYLNSQAIN